MVPTVGTDLVFKYNFPTHAQISQLFISVCGGGVVFCLGLFRFQNSIQFYNFSFSGGGIFWDASDFKTPLNSQSFHWGGVFCVCQNSKCQKLLGFHFQGWGDSGTFRFQNSIQFCGRIGYCVDFEQKFQPLQLALHHRSLVSHRLRMWRLINDYIAPLSTKAASQED